MKESGQTMQDEGLKENGQIEEAIGLLQKEPTEEMLAHVLTVIRRRMKNGGQCIVSVEPSLGSSQMSLSVLKTADGASWWTAFTSFDEELKGASQIKSTFLADMDRMFEAALAVPEIQGIILNPWNRTLMLDKTLLRIIRPEGNTADPV